jgi:hypothetical protein
MIPDGNDSERNHLRRYTGGFLADDAAAMFPHRAWLARSGPLRLRRGGPPLDAGPPRPLPPFELVVVEQSEGLTRLVYEETSLRLLVWAPDDALESVPVADTRLALRPRELPAGPAGAPEVGVWLMPGMRLSVVGRSEGWLEVAVEESGFQARGWVSEASLGKVFQPSTLRMTTHAGVREGARLLASPSGPPLGRFPLTPGEPAGINHWVEPVGAPTRGFQLVRFLGFTMWARGYLPLYSYVPPEGGGYGRGMRGRIRVRPAWGKVAPAASLPTGTSLFDGPGGEVVGRTRTPINIPDRLEHHDQGGQREIEVAVGGLGFVRVWVDVAQMGPLPPAPAPTASGKGG